tara:strand:+ start:1983 stop:2225 length:243 start_codon:yes stop_codon:yes gene_type:complete
MKAGDLVKIRGDIYNTGYSEHIKVSPIILQQINKVGIVIKITKYIHINERVDCDDWIDSVFVLWEEKRIIRHPHNEIVTL